MAPQLHRILLLLVAFYCLIFSMPLPFRHLPAQLLLNHLLLMADLLLVTVFRNEYKPEPGPILLFRNPDILLIP